MKICRFFIVWMICVNVYAQTTTNPLFSSSILPVPSGTSGGVVARTIDAQVKGFGQIASPSSGYLKSGVAGFGSVNFNGRGGTAVGVYGMGEAIGVAPSGQQNEVVGVYGRADKSGAYWATALHGECILLSADPGICIGANIEFAAPPAAAQTTLIGVNVNPHSSNRGVVGVQLQNSQTYKYGVDFNNTFIKVGDVNGVPFCMKFNSRNQFIEFWRGCQDPGALRVGYINMNYPPSDVQMNK